MTGAPTTAAASVGLTIAAVRCHVFRCKLETPVQTSFGTMRDRPMVLVGVTGASGETGWGEIWCNFPAVGAEHRARLVDSVLAPMLVGREFAHPGDAWRLLDEGTAVLAIQSAEPGPFAQAVAGIDTAIWDLAARQAGLPLWRMLGGTSPRIRVYASGLNPTAPEVLARGKHAEGFRAFKLKIGFDPARDIANLEALRDALGDEAALMVDANQGWTLDEASARVGALERFGLGWLEEPLRADRPWSEWHALGARTSIPLAGGENIAGDAAFNAALAERVLAVVQPDLAKWGGISRCLPLGRRVIAAGARYFPHYLGGGVGLLASAHVLAAAGGDGALEIDSNANPLRSRICGPLEAIENGFAVLGNAPGLGVEPGLEDLQAYLVPH